MNKATLNNLIGFVPENDAEREIFDSWRKDVLNDYLQDSKSTWSNGQFYLGGFIKMKPDEEITLKKIDEVKIIRAQRYIEYGHPCNSAEMTSIWRSERQLFKIEEIVRKYEEIYKLRVEKELLKIQNTCNILL